MSEPLDSLTIARLKATQQRAAIAVRPTWDEPAAVERRHSSRLTVHSLIERAGGRDAVCAEFGLSHDALRSWRDAGVIPSKYWPWFARKCGLTIEDVAGAR